MTHEHVREVDRAIADALEGERARQNDTLAMVASENHVSEAIMEAQSSDCSGTWSRPAPRQDSVLEAVAPAGHVTCVLQKTVPGVLSVHSSSKTCIGHSSS